MSALRRIEAREAAEAAAQAGADPVCPACADTGHVHGYAGRAEHCPCAGHLRAVVRDLQQLGHVARETIRRVRRAVIHSAADTPPQSLAADETPGSVKAGPGAGGLL